MDFKNLQNDFLIRYNTKTKPYCTFSGTPLFLMGDLLFPESGHSLITALSSGTALAISFEGSDYSIQQTRENTVFSCTGKKLTSYSEKNYTAPIFHAIAHLNSHFKLNPDGMKLLYEHNTISKGFHNYLAPLISAYLLLFPDTSPVDSLTALSPMKLTKEKYFSLLTTVSLKRGHINLTDNLSLLVKNYLLPFSEKKIILIKTDIKPKRICIDFSKDADPDDLSSEQQRILSFFVSEEKRVLKYPEITASSELHDLINDSGEDLLSLIDTPALTLLAETIRKTSALSLRPIINSSSLYAIVSDGDIDDFVEFVSTQYEKKAGYKPTFYITETCDSGIESGLIH